MSSGSSAVEPVAKLHPDVGRNEAYIIPDVLDARLASSLTKNRNHFV